MTASTDFHNRYVSHSFPGYLDGNKKKNIATTASRPAAITSLGPYDVLFGRNKAAFHSVGNRRFRLSISIHLQAYRAAKTRREKSDLFKYIVAFLRDEVGARFLKPVKGGYAEIGFDQAREKVGHALRDLAVAETQRSSAMAEQESSSSPKHTEPEQTLPQQVSSFIPALDEEKITAVVKVDEDDCAFHESLMSLLSSDIEEISVCKDGLVKM